MEPSVLTYNIEYSGNKTTDAVIDDIEADVVGVLERPWPLPPGGYRIHYLLADQYDSAGFVDVTVK